MKKLLPIVILLLSLFSCQSYPNEEGKIPSISSTDFILSMDSLKFSVEGSLRNVAQFQDKYFGLFERQMQSESDQGKKMVVFDKDMAFVEEVELSKEIQDGYMDALFVSGDSLFWTGFDSDSTICYRFDSHSGTMMATAPRPLKFFEDEAFEVFSACYGEWGGTIFFKDKQTGQFYEAMAACAKVMNKLDGSYYLTTNGGIVENAIIYRIQDPRKLEKSQGLGQLEQMEGSQAQAGLETYFAARNMPNFISFVADGALFHLYANGGRPVVGKVEAGAFKPLGIFDFPFEPKFCQHLKNGKLLLSCEFLKDNKSGMLIMNGKQFRFFKQR